MGKRSTYQFPFASLPALRIVLLLISGILVAHLYDGFLSWTMILGIFLTVFTLWLLTEYRFGSHLSILKTSAATFLYSLMIVVFGAGLYQYDQTRKTDAREKSAPLQLYEWETIKIDGTVRTSGTNQSGREIYEIETIQTTFPEGNKWTHRYRIRLYGSEVSNQPIIEGMRVTAEVRLFEFPKVRNPHDFDYGKWLHERSIVAHGELQNIINTKEVSSIGWGKARMYVQRNIELLFTKEQVPLAKALMIGYKDELTSEERLSFSRAGLSHIMAVSGMHVGFIIAPFWLIIPWLWRWKWGKWTGLFLMTLLLFGYAGITGFSASVSRASIMAWLLTYGKLFHKLRNSVNLLAVAAIILLLIRPNQLFDVGFQLSFSAVLIILLILPEAQMLISPKYRYNWKGGFLTIILISVVVQLGLFPILTTYFGEFSIAGPVANALVVPLLSIAVPTGLLITLLKGGSFGLSDLLAQPVGWILVWISSVAEYFGSEFTGYIEFTDISFWLFIFWFFGILTIATIRIPSLRWKMTIGLLIALNLLISERLIKKASSDNNMIVTVLDVGQGDAIHIRTPTGKQFLIDTGRWNPMGNSGERILLPYLEYLGVEKLDAVILSHPHADHIGGLPSLMESIPIDTIYHSDFPYDSRLYEQYIRLADLKKIPIQNVVAGDMIPIDPTIRIFVLGPDAGGIPDSNPNNQSLAVRIQYANTSFLFTGDAEVNQERKMVDRYGDFLDVNFLKVGHHGSRTSSTQYFVDVVNPEIAVASLAFRNRFNHPNTEAISNLANTGSKKYFTSLSGALIFKSDGHTILSLEP